MKRENPFLVALALLGGVIFLAPVLYSIWMSFQTAQAYYTGGLEFTLENYTVAVGQYKLRPLSAQQRHRLWLRDNPWPHGSDAGSLRLCPLHVPRRECAVWRHCRNA